MAKRPNTGSIVRDRKKTILVVLACVFVLSLVYRMLNPYEQKRVEELTFTGTKTRSPINKTPSGSAKIPPGDLRVRLDLLSDNQIHSGAVQNNIFFRKKDISVKEQPADQERPLTQKTAQPASPLVAKRLQIQQELSQFKTFGLLERDKVKTLFLERGKDIFIIKEGDRIDDKYLIKEITETMLTLRAEEIDEDIHLDISQF